MSTQLTFGLMSGIEKFRPYAVGDVVVKHDGTRYMIEALEPEAYAQPALICVAQASGARAILFEREIAYRSC